MLEIQALSMAAPREYMPSNIYGNNPNTQGRNFVNARQVANPGYQIDGGYMSDVKTFLAIPATTRRLRDEPEPGTDLRINEDKLALELVLVPAVIDPAPTGDDGGDDINPNDPNDPSNPNSGNKGGVAGCSVSSNGTSGGLFAMVFALFFVIRRRRR